MKHLLAWTASSLASAVVGGSLYLSSNALPPPTKAKIVLHGINCSVQSGEVCPEDRPVFVAAAALLANEDRPTTTLVETSGRTVAQPCPVELAAYLTQHALQVSAR